MGKRGPASIPHAARCAVRFWKYVSPEPNTGCWLWTASTDICGYGKLSIARSRWEHAHRVSWRLLRSEPGPLSVLHRCDNRMCVNPDHLFLGTAGDNARDAAKKGRLSPQTNPERYRKPPSACITCGRFPRGRAGARGECHTCVTYRRRTGRRRPVAKRCDVLIGLETAQRGPEDVAERLKEGN